MRIPLCSAVFAGAVVGPTLVAVAWPLGGERWSFANSLFWGVTVCLSLALVAAWWVYDHYPPRCRACGVRAAWSMWTDGDTHARLCFCNRCKRMVRRDGAFFFDGKGGAA